jgi:hypothetical protein
MLTSIDSTGKIMHGENRPGEGDGNCISSVGF